MTFNFIKFFKFSYLFDLRPTISPSAIYVLAGFFGVLVLAGIIMKILQKTGKREHFLEKLFNEYFACLTTLGLFGLLLVWFRYEQVFVFSGRFWLLVWAAVMAVWLYHVLKYQLTVVPQARRQLAERREFEKYLPKKK